MCNPIAIGLMVAGTAMQVNAQRQRQKAMENAAEDAQNAEALRQGSLTKEREQALGPALENATRANQDAALEEAAAKRKAAYEGDTSMPGSEGTADYQAPSAAAAEGQPTVVRQEADKQKAKADAEVRSIGDARARLASYGDVGLGNQILNRDSGNQINMLGGFARSSAALLPGEVQAAMNSKAGKGRTQEMLGSALSMYGSFGAPGAGGAATAAAGGAGGATGMYGNAINTGAGSTLGATAPMAGAMSPSFPPIGATQVPWWQQAGTGIGSLLASNRRTQ